jgi:hypothetical protein
MNHRDRHHRSIARRLITLGAVMSGIAVAVAAALALAASGSHTQTARAEAKRLLTLLHLTADSQPSAGEPSGAGARLSSSPSVPSVPHLIALHEFFTAPGAPATFIAALHRPAGSKQGDSGASPGERWTSFEFGPIPHVVALRELVVNAVQLRAGTVAVRVDSQTAPLPRLPGSGRGPGDVRVVESGTRLGSFAFRLRCDPPGGTVPGSSRVCSAIRANPALLHSVAGPDHSCPFGGPTISVTGTWNQQRLSSTFSVCTGGQEQQAVDWAGLLPSEKTEAALHTDRGIGLVTLGESEAAAVELLRGARRAPPICQACTRKFSAGYYSSSGPGPERPVGWTITFSEGRVARIENNAAILTINGAYATRGFASLRRALRGWSTRTCAHTRELVHASRTGTTIIVYGAEFERLVVSAAPPSCI